MKNKYLLVSLVSVLVLLIGVSMAFFTTSIIGSRKNITVTSKEVKVIFTDSPAFTENNIKPGWNISKTFSVENISGRTYIYDLMLDDLINTFVTTGGLQYKIESTNSGYNTNNEWIDVPKSASANDATIASNISVATNVTQSYTIYLRYYDTGLNQDDDQGKTFSGKIAIIETPPTFVEKVLELNPTRLTRSGTDFNSILTTINTGTLYTTTNTEDGSTVYYFAGNALNNWVKFGKCTSSSYNCTVGDDLYWRIIRTNETIEDGGIRLLYAGSGSVSNQNAYIKLSKYNDSDGCASYVGYMYGEECESLESDRTNQEIKSNPATHIAAWYTATFNNGNNTKDVSGNLLTNYINPSAIYCNERSIGSGTYNMDSSNFYYGAYVRIGANKNPSLACGTNASGYNHYFETNPSIADKFTGSTKNSSNQTIGNGLLSSTPAALMTADEVMFAGSLYDVNNSVSNVGAWYYYNAANTPASITNSRFWWTMTPNNSYGSQLNFVFYVLGLNGVGRYGQINSGMDVSYQNNAVRPVISLKSSVRWVSGDGSPNSPFEIKL